MSDGPIIKDALYFGFWAVVAILGLVGLWTAVYLLWRILNK